MSDNVISLINRQWDDLKRKVDQSLDGMLIDGDISTGEAMIERITEVVKEFTSGEDGDLCE